MDKRTIRGLCLTAKGRAAIGVPEPPVWVPLLRVTWLASDLLDEPGVDGGGA